MADLEQSLAELESVKQAFKTNIDATNISTSGVEFRNMPNLVKQMEKKLPTQTKSVKPTTSEQNVSADTGYKLIGVKVGAVNPSDYYKPEEIANVTPTTSDQKITPTANAVFKEINVSAVTSTIDGNIKEENIKKGVTILGVTGTMEESSGESSKFAELVDGSITSVDEIDLARVETIKSYAFGGCQNLASVKIPSNVKTIGDGAFEACENLQTLSLAEGIEKIGATAFAGINAPINLPSTLTEVGNSAFAGNQALTSITIPSGLTVLSADMFAFCQNLTDVTMLATTPPLVGVGAFPENVVRIYVPYSAYDDYISSSYWTAYTSKIVRLPAKPSTITVTVNNYLGEMVSGTSVTITGNNQTYTGTTDSAGVFSQGDLQPATYTVSVADLEGLKTPDGQEVVVEEDTQNNVVFTYLEKPTVILFADATPAEISAISANISANNMTSEQVAETYGWNIGDTKNITLSTGEVVEMAIIGFNHDDKSDGSGKAGITLQTVGLMKTSRAMNNSATGAGGYPASLMKTSYIPAIKATLPQEWQDVIVMVDKKSSNGNSQLVTTSEDLFLVSYYELTGSTMASDAQTPSDGNKYEYWDGRNKKKYDSSGNVQAWWLRTSSKYDGFMWVVKTGSIAAGNASNKAYVSFAFCI